VKAQGRGSPRDWVARGVQDDLRDLGRLNSEFPVALVALSPLYSHEVMTEEAFLVKVLGISQKTLEQLVYRGKATRENDDKAGFVFYGLPHSALADLYWEHGRLYRRRKGLPEYEDFIYAYAVSDTPNGLEAVTQAPPDTTSRLHARLRNKGVILGVLERKADLGVISLWAYGLYWTADHDYLRTDGLLNVLAKRLNTCDDLPSVSRCLGGICRFDRQAGQELWASLDHAELARRLTWTEGFPGIHAFMWAFPECEHNMRLQLAKLLNSRELANRMMEQATLHTYPFVWLTYSEPINVKASRSGVI